MNKSQNPPSQIRSKEKRPTLSDLSELGLQRERVLSGWETNDLLSTLLAHATRPLSQSPETPELEPGEPTTPNLPAPKTEVPEQLKSVQGDKHFEVLANGYSVPRYLIEVLNDFDSIWPGATLHEARPAVAAQILIAYDAKRITPHQFCMNDDASIPDKGSPCILNKGHRGRHKDNDDGSWP